MVMILGTAPCVGQTCLFAEEDHEENPLGFDNSETTDSEVAVGTDRILTCSNAWLRLLDKSGNLVSPGQARLGDDPLPSAPDPFFFPSNSPQTNSHFFIGDPAVYFDHENSRFWVVACEAEFIKSLGAWAYSHFHIAVSTSATPANWTTAWLKYDYCLAEPGGCTNFDGVAHNLTIFVDGDTLYITTVDDQQPTGTRRSSLVMIDKVALMNGTQAAPQIIELENAPHNETTWGHTVAVEYDAWNNTRPVYTVVSGNAPSGAPTTPQTTIRIGAITNSGGTFSYQSFNLTGGNLAPWFDNAGTSATPTGTVTPLLRTFMHATHRPDATVGGRIWTCAHIRASTGGANPTPVPGNFVRYYEIHTNGWPTSGQNPTLAWSADIHPAGLETYDPSIAVDMFGNIGLAWTQSGPNLQPEFWMGVQRYIDAVGVLGQTRLIHGSNSTRTVGGGQVIDYSGIDPDAWLCRFVGHSGLAKANSTTLWQSHVGSLCTVDTLCLSDFADQDDNRVFDERDGAEFNRRFQAGDRRADCNRDTRLDVMDYVCFNDIFETARRQR